MAECTILADVDETIAAKISSLAEINDRPPAEIAGHAITFYTSLSNDAHSAIQMVEKMGSSEEIRWMMDEVMRVLFRVEMKIVQRKMATEMGIEQIKTDSENDNFRCDF